MIPKGSSSVSNNSREINLDNLKLEFPAILEGDEYKIRSLGYKDGSLMFGYITDVISLLRTDKFPLGRLDILPSQTIAINNFLDHTAFPFTKKNN